MKTKSFTLISENEEEIHWSIITSILENEIFNGKGIIQIQGSKKTLISYRKEYRKSHKKQLAEIERRYRKTKKGKESRIKAERKYSKTSKGKKNHKRAQRKFYQTEKGKLKHRIDQKKVYSKRKRELGFIPLNEYFSGSHAHHVDNEYIIYIPAKVHQMFNGHSRNKHRRLVLDWLRKNDRKLWKLVISKIRNDKND